jgi:GR25 family glycosyltransferase involved in LPS biosynthesis
MRQLFWPAVLMLIPSLFFADIADHLKKVGDKSSLCSVPKVDCIYMINLDQRPEKWQRSLDQLLLFGIYPCRFSAVNGWELTLEEINDVGLKFAPPMEAGILGTCYPLGGRFEPRHETIRTCGQTYFCHCMSRGAIGIALSHISVLQDAFDAGYETIWVMEDDIDVVSNPRNISDKIEQLDAIAGKEHWDILFTDRDIRDANGCYATTYWAGKRPDYLAFTKDNDYTVKAPTGTGFIRIGARSGAHSMIIRRSGIKKLLQFFHAHQIFFPYDMEYILPRGIQLYTVAEDIVTNLSKAPSDNGGPYYLEKGDR